MAAGITITADSATQFETGAAEYNSTCRLDDNNFAVAYRDNNDGNKGKVNVGSRSGVTPTISESNAVVFNNDTTTMITVRALSSTKIVISYQETNTIYGYVVVCSISGTTITVGTPVKIGNSTAVSRLSVAVLDSTNFVATRAGAGIENHYVCSVSGTTITMGSVQAGAVSGNSSNLGSYTVGLDSTHFVSCYLNNGVLAQAMTVDTGAQTITFGAGKLLSGNTSLRDPLVAMFDSQHFIIASKTSGTYQISVTAASVDLSTLDITGGNGIGTSASAPDNSFSIATMGQYNFILSYYTATGTQGELVGGNLTGGPTIAFDAQGAVVFDNGTSDYTALCRLTDTYFLLGYKRG